MSKCQEQGQPPISWSIFLLVNMSEKALMSQNIIYILMTTPQIARYVMQWKGVFQSKFFSDSKPRELFAQNTKFIYAYVAHWKVFAFVLTLWKISNCWICLLKVLVSDLRQRAINIFNNWFFYITLYNFISYCIMAGRSFVVAKEVFIMETVVLWRCDNG